MNETQLAPHPVRRKYPKWVNFVLAATIGVGVGMGQGFAAPGINPNKPVISQPNRPATNKVGQPIQTKSGRKAAIQDATEALLKAAPGTLRAPTPIQADSISLMGFPGGPTDATAVPHYFGPWPNWALSPLTVADATVTSTLPL